MFKCLGKTSMAIQTGRIRAYKMPVKRSALTQSAQQFSQGLRGCRRFHSRSGTIDTNQNRCIYQNTTSHILELQMMSSQTSNALLDSRHVKRRSEAAQRERAVASDQPRTRPAFLNDSDDASACCPGCSCCHCRCVCRCHPGPHDHVE